MSEYYIYKNNLYKLVDYARHKKQGSDEFLVAVYTDGKVLYTRNVAEFFRLFTQVPNDSTAVAAFELRERTKK